MGVVHQEQTVLMETLSMPARLKRRRDANPSARLIPTACHILGWPMWERLARRPIIRCAICDMTRCIRLIFVWNIDVFVSDERYHSHRAPSICKYPYLEAMHYAKQEWMIIDQLGHQSGRKCNGTLNPKKPFALNWCSLGTHEIPNWFEICRACRKNKIRDRLFHDCKIESVSTTRSNSNRNDALIKIADSNSLWMKISDLRLRQPQHTVMVSY